jgi:hypothetical protein
MKPIYPNNKFHNLPSMTVEELIEKLQQYPRDAVVIAEWEGTWNAVDPVNFEYSKTEHHLIIGVENH